MASLGPFCRGCGKQIPKFKRMHWFGKSTRKQDFYSCQWTELPYSKEEVQQIIGDEPVLSVRYWTPRSRETDSDAPVASLRGNWIYHATSWYNRAFAATNTYFCKMRCAAEFGESAVREHDLGSAKYWSRMT